MLPEQQRLETISVDTSGTAGQVLTDVLEEVQRHQKTVGQRIDDKMTVGQWNELMVDLVKLTNEGVPRLRYVELAATAICAAMALDRAEAIRQAIPTLEVRHAEAFSDGGRYIIHHHPKVEPCDEELNEAVTHVWQEDIT